MTALDKRRLVSASFGELLEFMRRLALFECAESPVQPDAAFAGSCAVRWPRRKAAASVPTFVRVACRGVDQRVPVSPGERARSSNEQPGYDPRTIMASEQPSVFISYSHVDEEWKNLLVEHLGVLGDRVRTWNDSDIRTGDDWKAEIERELNAASVAVLLVSVSFVNSRFVQRVEIPNLLEAREQRGLRIVPVILRPCAWRSVPWLSRLQVRPRGGQPLLMHDKGRVAIEAEFASLAEDIVAWLERAPATPTPSAVPQAAAERSGVTPLGSSPRPADDGPPERSTATTPSPPSSPDKIAAPVYAYERAAPALPPFEPKPVHGVPVEVPRPAPPPTDVPAPQPSPPPREPAEVASTPHPAVPRAPAPSDGCR